MEKLEHISLDNYKEVLQEYIREDKLDEVNYELLISRIEGGVVGEMTSFELAKYCSEVAAAMITHSVAYDKLAAKILLKYYSSSVLPTFSERMRYIQEKKGNLKKEVYDMVMENQGKYNSIIDYSRDFSFSYFAVLTLFRSYIIKIEGVPAETPQDVYMRIAIQIHRDRFDLVEETYNLLSQGYYTHSTPTMFNSMAERPQLASCFLVTPKKDTIEDIYEMLRDCAIISKFCGGIGISLHDVRSCGSKLKSTEGVSKGIILLIRLFNETLNYINVASSRRHSSIAFYLEPWHKDIIAFLNLRKNTGSEDQRARDVFTALWVNDLFMGRVEADGEWSLFDPSEAKGLSEVWGDEFKELYEKYEKELDKEVMSARDLLKAIVMAQIETGTPYMVYKDTSNRLSNQKNLGTIKCSNLCTEIIEYSSGDETAVCNLASICLPKFVEDGGFNYSKLKDVVKVVCKNLNRVIDTSYHPTVEAERSNKRHRPIGIGVQGLADVFAMLRQPYDSVFAKINNAMIFETLYYAALEASVELAEVDGPYESFNGSPLSQGIFHFEMAKAKTSGMWDWEALRARVMKHGARNSLLIAPMPTAGTSQISGNTECFEPFTSNIYTRRTLAGEFQVVNTYLMNDLKKLGIWNEEMRQLIIDCNGSIQKVPGIPAEIKNMYKTVWEIKMKTIIDMAADRQAFIDQSQSLNLYLEEPTYPQVASMHFYAWKRGLKTGMYYLRTRPISSAIKFTIDKKVVNKAKNSLQESEGVKQQQDEKESENYGNNIPVCEGCSC